MRLPETLPDGVTIQRLQKGISGAYIVETSGLTPASVTILILRTVAKVNKKNRSSRTVLF